MGNAGRFTGRVALVTGGASGIGAAVAQRLADERARVASLDLEAVSLNGASALGRDAPAPSEVEAAVAEARSELGPIDILVCSTGVPERPPHGRGHRRGKRRRGGPSPTAPLPQPSGHPGDGRARLRPNRERRLDRREGRGTPWRAPVSASKAAVIAMTKAIGKDVARTGVLVNCTRLAVIETPMLGGMSEEQVEYMVDRIPMGPAEASRRRSSRSSAGLRRGGSVLDGRDGDISRRQGGLLVAARRSGVHGPAGLENGTAADD